VEERKQKKKKIYPLKSVEILFVINPTPPLQFAVCAKQKEINNAKISILFFYFFFSKTDFQHLLCLPTNFFEKKLIIIYWLLKVVYHPQR
jgi:hypothetical protein